MKSYELHAGWLNPHEKIGDIIVENSRGHEIISFAYADEWIIKYPNFILDPDIYPLRGRQYVSDSKPCFGFLSDTAPDRWGRKLIDRRERIDAKKENRSPKTLFESDYIFGVNDKGRTGALRFFDSDKEVYVSDRDILAAPPITELRRLEQASLNLENSKDPNEEKWFRDLIEPGSSLGGARPKANVVDEKGNMWIAKFPSKNDEINVGAWEMVLHDLQKKCNINVPDAMKLDLSDSGSTFLVKRFDRDGNKRIHFSSAMTMLGETDNSKNLIGYIDIAGVIETICKNPERNLKELWTRLVFNICSSNTDDHLRNHGFLYNGNGWELSPAYDVNPNPEKDRLSLLIGDDNIKDLNAAIEICEYFRYDIDEAKEKASSIQNIINESWRHIADYYHISRAEQNAMEIAFEQAY